MTMTCTKQVSHKLILLCNSSTSLCHAMASTSLCKPYKTTMTLTKKKHLSSWFPSTLDSTWLCQAMARTALCKPYKMIMTCTKQASH